MASREEPGTWSPLHDLGLLYLTFMFDTDANIAPEELQVMGERLQAWHGDDADEETIEQVIQEVMLVFMSRSSDQMIETCIAALTEALTQDERVAVLNDLADLANADGLLYPGEVGFIQQLARNWGLEQHLQ